MQTKTYHDFDAFAESIRHVDSRMLLRHPKNRTWRISSVDLGRGITVQTGQLGSGNIAAGELQLDGYMFYKPLTDTVEYSVNGIVVEKNSLAILEPGCEFCISTRVAHDWVVAFIPSHILIPGNEAVVPLQGSKRKRCRVIRPNLQTAERFRSLTGEIMMAASIFSHFESTNAALCAGAELLEIVSSLVAQPQHVERGSKGRKRLPRDEIIRRAEKLLEARHGEHLSVEELAVAARVSQRTLQTAFNDYYGTGPAQYMQLRTLNHVHRALKTADPEADLVCDILMAHGEWEFSRFASRYRRLFGELPSETLRSRGR